MARGRNSNESLHYEWLADRLFDRIEQHFCRKWFAQKRNAARRRGLFSNHFIVEARHEYDGVRITIRHQLVRQFHARNVAELDINNETSCLAGRCASEKCFRRIKSLRAIAI